MCGRFTLAADTQTLQSAFPQVNFPAQAAPRYNIAPGTPVLALPNDGQRRATFFVWGLIPGWAKDPALGQNLINARAETLGEKASFRGAYKYRRCLIFADGFYEWQAQPASKNKIPHFIHLKNGAPFALAGLWEIWHSPDGGELASCAIITTTPNALMATLHARMPVILPRSAWESWLSPEPRSPQELQEHLRPYPAQEMEAFPVSTQVNRPANDHAGLIQPLQ